MDNFEPCLLDNSHLQTILSNSKRCLEIFFGERPDEECLQCPYRDKGVDCVFSLIEEQDKILRLLKKEIHGRRTEWQRQRYVIDVGKY